MGWGETRALPVWSYETLESITYAVRNYLAPLVMGRSPFELNAIHRAMYETLTPSVSNGQPFAKSAVDIALHDLQGQISGQPVHALLGGKVRDRVPLTYALSIAAPDEMAAAGGGQPGVLLLQDQGGGRSRAGRGASARHLAGRAGRHPVAGREPGVRPGPARAVPGRDPRRCRACSAWSSRSGASTGWGCGRPRERSPFPVAIDEGCFSASTWRGSRSWRAAELVVLKVCKSGGLRECLKSATVADAHGMGLLGSGLTESGVGFTASIHYFAAVDTLLPPELNGVQFLEFDVGGRSAHRRGNRHRSGRPRAGNRGR